MKEFLTSTLGQPASSVRVGHAVTKHWGIPNWQALACA